MERTQETNCDLCCGNWRQKAAHPPGPGPAWTLSSMDTSTQAQETRFGSVKESGGRTKRQPPVHNETALLLFLEFLPEELHSIASPFRLNFFLEMDSSVN